MSRPTCPHCGGFIVLVNDEDDDEDDDEDEEDDEDEGACVCGNRQGQESADLAEDGVSDH